MHRLQPDRAIPHPLEPAGVLSAGSRALPAEPPSRVLAEAAAETVRPGEGVAGLRRGEAAAEEGPGGAEEVACGRHCGWCICVPKLEAGEGWCSCAWRWKPPVGDSVGD